jgi:diamine N-acetyltransferase
MALASLYKNYYSSLGRVHIQPICIKDIEQIRLWRNSDRIRNTTIKRDLITKQMQKKWFSELNLRMDYVFKIQLDSKFIGVASSKIIDSKKLIMQPSLYIGDSLYDGKGYGVCGLILLNDFCFDSMKASGLIINILKSNNKAIRFNEGIGYTVESENKDYCSYTLTPDQYYSQRKGIMKLISRIS